MSQQYHDLLGGLGAAMGLPELAPDETGVIDLVFDDALPIRLAFDEDRDEIIAFAAVGEMPASAAVEQLEELLRSNLTMAEASASFALDEDRVILSRKWPVGKLELPQWEGDLAALVETGMHWRDRLARPVADGGGEPADFTAVRV